MNEKENSSNFHEEEVYKAEMSAFDAVQIIRQAELDIASLNLGNSSLKQQADHDTSLVAIMGLSLPLVKILFINFSIFLSSLLYLYIFVI